MQLVYKLTLQQNNKWRMGTVYDRSQLVEDIRREKQGRGYDSVYIMDLFGNKVGEYFL